MDIYGQRQLVYMMKSSFFEQALVNSGFSIKDYIRAGQVDITFDKTEQAAFDNIMCRA